MARMSDSASRSDRAREERYSRDDDDRPRNNDRNNDGEDRDYSDEGDRGRGDEYDRDDDERDDRDSDSSRDDDDRSQNDERDNDGDSSGERDDERDQSRSSDDSQRQQGRGPQQGQRGDDSRQQYDRNAQHGRNQFDDRRQNKKQKFKQKLKGNKGPQQQGGGYQNHARPQQQGQQGGGYAPQGYQRRAPQPQRGDYYGREEAITIEVGDLPDYEVLRDIEAMNALAAEHASGGEALDIIELLTMNLHGLITRCREEFQSPVDGMPVRPQIVEQVLNAAWEAKRSIMVEGIVETTPDGYGLLVYQHENYRVRPLCSFVPRVLMRRYGLKRGCIVKAQVQPPRKELTRDGNKENCPIVLRVESVMGKEPMENLQVTPFEDLTPYYPTERLLLETGPEVKWDNVSMRVVDLLTPVGKGQRGLIVAPPRTGKTILQQGIANAVMKNNPEAHLIILLVDERPEEVTDFRRQITKGEVIASTFDENAESHVHAAEMVIEKARRMVEIGRHVIILLDSITRLGRAYNTLAANSGKILSGGVEATALQKPKRFFGSARNIEGGGSLTILGTALVETGSRMDEVIFEEFKGTGNMELVLDRAMVDKRIFPAINLEKSGTRKEELLYHPEELVKVYGLRRAMKGVPSPDAMEMLITRVKKTKTNIEFLMGLNR